MVNISKKQRDGQYDAYLGAWAMDAVEGDMYQIWHSKSSVGGGSNKIFYNNPMVDSLIETIRGEFDFEKRKSLYQDVQKIIYEDQPYTFLISQVFTGSYSARFQNVEFFQIDHVLQQIYGMFQHWLRNIKIKILNLYF